MKLYLIRHGETLNNVEGVIDTAAPGALLSQQGYAQAQALVERMEGIKLDAVYVSNLTRTHLTAAPLCAARSIVPIQLPALAEIEAGQWEGGATQEEFDGYFTTVRRWFEGMPLERLGGGVNLPQVLARMDGAIADICASGAENVAVFSHGAMISVWAGHRVAGITYEHAVDKHLSNTAMLVAEGDSVSGFRGISWAGEPVRAR